MVVELNTGLAETLLATMQRQLETPRDLDNDDERVAIGVFKHDGREYCVEVRIRPISRGVGQ